MTRRVPAGPALPGAFAPAGDLLVVEDGQRVVCLGCLTRWHLHHLASGTTAAKVRVMWFVGPAHLTVDRSETLTVHRPGP